MKAAAGILSNMFRGSQALNQATTGAALGGGLVGLAMDRLRGTQPPPTVQEERKESQPQLILYPTDQEEEIKQGDDQGRIQEIREANQLRTYELRQADVQNILQAPVEQQSEIELQQLQTIKQRATKQRVYKLGEQGRDQRGRFTRKQTVVVRESAEAIRRVTGAQLDQVEQFASIYDLDDQEQNYPMSFEENGEIDEESRLLLNNYTEDSNTRMQQFNQRRQESYARILSNTLRNIQQIERIPERDRELVSELLTQAQVISLGLAESREEIEEFTNRVQAFAQAHIMQQEIIEADTEQRELPVQQVVQAISQLAQAVDVNPQQEERKMPLTSRLGAQIGNTMSQITSWTSDQMRRLTIEASANQDRPATYNEILATFNTQSLRIDPLVRNVVSGPNLMLLNGVGALIYQIYYQPTLRQLRNNTIFGMIGRFMNSYSATIVLLVVVGKTVRDLIKEDPLDKLQKEIIKQKGELDDLKNKYAAAREQITEQEKNKHQADLKNIRTDLEKKFPQCKRRFYIHPETGILHSIVECTSESILGDKKRYYQDV